MTYKPKTHRVVEPVRCTKVTVYKLHYPGHQVIQEYYDYFYGHMEESLYVESCPGCGVNLKYTAWQHKCNGRLTEEPLNNKFRGMTVKNPNVVEKQQSIRQLFE